MTDAPTGDPSVPLLPGDLSGMALGGDLPEPLSGVAGGLGDVDLALVAVQERTDEGVQLITGGIGAGLLSAQLCREGSGVGEARRVAHVAERSTLANTLDKLSRKANTIGMTNEQHTGKPAVLPYANGYAILCPLGHVVDSIRESEWAHSLWESRVRDGATVTCRGSSRQRIEGCARERTH